MTNHDHPLPSGKKSLNEFYAWYKQGTQHSMEHSGIYKQLMAPAITALDEVSLSWSRQVCSAIEEVTSPLNKQIQVIFDDIKPDFSWIGAELVEYNRASLLQVSQALTDSINLDYKELFAPLLSTSVQVVFDSIKPDYTNIFANLSEFSTVSMATQAKIIADIIKPDRNTMFASLAKINMPTNELFASLAKISMPTMVGTIKFDFNNKAHTPFAYAPNHHQKTELVAAIWYTAYDLDTLRRREKVVAILKETGIHYETPLFGAYDSYMRKHIDYKRHVFSSLRTVLHDLVYLCVKGIDTDDICEFLEKKEVQKKHYTNKDGSVIRSHAAVLYLSIERPIPEERKKRLIQLSITLNDLHTANIQRSDLNVYQMILEMEVMICEVFPDWLNQ